MKRLYLSLALALLTCISLTACTEEPTTGDGASNLVSDFDIWAKADIPGKEANAGCPSQNVADCLAFDAARTTWDDGVGPMCSKYQDGHCTQSPYESSVSTEKLMYVECLVIVGASHICSCAIKAGDKVMGMYMDFGCNGSGGWINAPSGPQFPVCDIVPCCTPGNGNCG